MLQLKQIKHLALDLDGTLYLDGKLFEWTQPFLKSLRRMGIGQTFFTNNSSKSTRQYVEHLRKLGIETSEKDIYSSTTCTIQYLRNELPAARRLYVLGTPALREEFVAAGYEVVGENATDGPEAVVVGFDTTLSYERVCRSAWWISKGKPFIATHCDLVCPTSEANLRVDCGAICAMLAAATGRKPDAILGKPHPMMLSAVMREHNLPAANMGVVGDRLYTDIAMARQAGAMSILVLSGETTRQQAESDPARPDMIVANVAELQRALEREREAAPC